MAPQLISVIGCLHTDCYMMIDRVPERGESLAAKQYREVLGGKGANSAIAAYRSCHARPPDGIVPVEERVDEDNDEEIEVCMIGAVGDDEYGPPFFSQLRKNGVDVSGIRQMAGQKTGVSFVLVEVAGGDNRCTFANNANDAWTVEDFTDIKSLACGRPPDLIIAQLEIKRAVVEQMIETAGEAGIEFLLNAAPASSILGSHYPLITHLLVNETEAATLTGRDVDEVDKDSWQEIADYFLEKGVKNVVLTLGANGAFFARTRDSSHVPASRVKTVDCTGAGDTFTGTYASDYLRQKRSGQWDLQAAVRRACRAAALITTQIGAQEGIPWMDEIDNFEDPSEVATEASEEL